MTQKIKKDRTIRHKQSKMESIPEKTKISELVLPKTEEKLIKSRERVKNLAEIYTAEREVLAMLVLLPDNLSYDISSKYLEPACGNGNFLVKILERKMKTVNETYKDLRQYELEKRNYEINNGLVEESSRN